MRDETLVSAADIARLADVGRSAVSNWRRRYPGFPQPAGGTPSGPLFVLAEVEAWLHAQDKLLEAPLAERAWQELRARAGDDLRLAIALGDLGDLLLAGQDVTGAPGELVAKLGAAAAFELLLERLHTARSRSVTATPGDIAELMAAFAPDAAAVLDPSCGTGELLLAASGNGARRLAGQDADPDAARLAEIRLRLADGNATVRGEDALHRDAFPGMLADAVLCAPPAHKRALGHELYGSDPRWAYGVPPRLEPELAWVQHMLAHLSPGGLGVALVPAAAAARRPGRRIRAQLLRRGALRAVLAVSATAHLWVLRQPETDSPETVLMAAADPERLLAIWQASAADPSHDRAGESRAVRIIDLLDDEVDLTPGRHLSAPAPERTAERFIAASTRLTTVAGGLGALSPELRAAAEPRPPDLVAVAELARIGHLEIHQAPVRGDAGAGSDPVLTAQDVVEGRPASGRGLRDERWITLRAGDIVVAVAGGRFAVRVLSAEGEILGPTLTLLRVDPAHLDSHFVAGALRSSANSQASVTQSGSTVRADVWRAQIPRLPLAAQHRYGAAFRRIEELQAAARSAAAMGAELARLLADGVAGGTLEPPDEARLSR